MDTKIKIITMRLMRKQVENVRAMFTVDIGPIRLIDCYLIGKIHQNPDTMSIAMPGRKSRDGQSWKTLAVLSPDVAETLKNEAQLEYLRLIEPYIARNTIEMPSYLFQQL